MAAVLVILSLGTDGLAECAGWATSPEARMDCCEDGSCPMHAAARAHGAHRATTQAQADSCCAVSDPGDSAPPTVAFVIAPSPLASAPARVGPRADRVVVLDARPAHVPRPGRRVAPHVLLSVFLI